MEHGPIFISARFRSGSTFLWNIFRQIPECQAFYEPCNDLLVNHIQIGTRPTASHAGVTSYWDEYLPILDELRRRHRPEFGLTRLCLESTDAYPALEDYIRFLVTSTPGRVPVLQFNRVDLRLPWLRTCFPDATIIHLVRNSRDSWYSMVRELPQETWDDPLLNTSYDLVLWSLALYDTFPFLFSEQVSSSYHRHYLLWRLSALMGERQSHLSLDYDRRFLADPAGAVDQLVSLTGLGRGLEGELAGLMVTPKTGEWRRFADPGWFDGAEAECDSMLASLGLLADFGRRPLAAIRRDHRQAWAGTISRHCRTMVDVATKMCGDLRSRLQLLGHDAGNEISSYRSRLAHIADAADLDKPWVVPRKDS